MTDADDDIDELPPLATRPLYDESQVREYYIHIGVRQESRHSDVSSLSEEDKLKHLTLVLRRTLVTLPFENLSLHYSVHKQMYLSPSLLFEKIVRGRCDDGTVIPGNKRGGYCMQNNNLFGTFLRSIGFDTMSVAARVKDSKLFSGWGHMVNVVQIADKRYHLDVGFGPNGPTVPLPFEHGYTVPHIGPAQQRMRYTRLQEHANANSRIWTYEMRPTPDQPWQLTYCIGADTEYLPQDYAVLNYAVSHRRDTWFAYRICCARFTAVAEDSDELNGALILDNGLKRRLLGQNEKIVDQFKDEAERLTALQDHFGIHIPPEDAAAIRDLPSHIKS